MSRRILRRARAGLRSLRPHAVRRRVFTEIFESGAWGSQESASGTGSTLEQTEAVREALPGLLRDLGVDVLVDVPCGDWHWMRHVELPVKRYVGLDVVPGLVARDVELHGRSDRDFLVHDVTRRPPPRGDLVLCRDLLVHLSNADLRLALDNLRRSGSTWLLTTTFLGDHSNDDIETGSWRPLNLQLPPWSFPPPERVIDERCTVDGGRWPDKSLGLWRLSDLPRGR